ncbi:pancreatic lipase-related protein 2-like [Rhinophrynus dorsalis]
MFALWTVLLLVGCVQGGKVCYERIGCFTDEAPWGGTLERPIGRLPMSPEQISPRFLLFTRENPENFQELSALNPSSISSSNFKTRRITHFIIHGFIDKGEESWLADMCKTMLKVENVNCICVDWMRGSRTLYTIAANNIRVVGAEVAYFINLLKSNFGYTPNNVHIIGHSLGSHAAGEAGKRVPGLGRITGLDPAGPFFIGTPPEVRLDPTDAMFVDAIHTDAALQFLKMGYGMPQPVGHLDFYPNGGEDMPGCNKNPLFKLADVDGVRQGINDIFACNHLRSYKYYTESITTPDGFVGFSSPSYKAFQTGTGFPCPSTGCPLMGHFADTYSDVTSNSQSFYLNTGDAKPYSRWRYRVTVQTTGNFNALGSIYVTLHGPQGNTQQQEIFSGPPATCNPISSFVFQLQMFGLWTVLLLVGCVQGGKVCYERIGCFTDEAPWGGTLERPIGRLPMSPEQISPRFLLFTPENPDNFQELSALNPSSISSSNFKTRRITRFIIHGFLSEAEDSWLTDMCKTMLKVEDVNCICVDWRRGSRTLYSIAANNIRVVGAEVAYFINLLKSNFGYTPNNVHIIGHSLGSHTAGEAGKRVPGLGRITGLDPAGPFFKGTPPEVRLDPTDAMFVDAIHTDAASQFLKMGFGMPQPVGHLDFYPNGGEEMPGCNKNPLFKLADIDGVWQGASDIVACNHLRSYKYYTESITSPDGFVGFSSPSYKAFQTGTGFPCPSTGCPLMGHFADTYSDITSNSQSFYLNTGDAKPYSRWRYRVTVQTTGNFNALGTIYVTLHGPQGNTQQKEIFK